MPQKYVKGRKHWEVSGLMSVLNCKRFEDLMVYQVISFREVLIYKDMEGSYLLFSCVGIGKYDL